MITAINKKDNKRIFSYKIESLKYILENKNNFKCPNCNSELIFVNCTKKIKHFRHKISSDCEWERETEEHINMKRFFIDKLKLNPSEVEVNLKFAIPDIYLKDKRIAIEVQHSSISEEKFLERTKRYTENNIYSLWIFHPKLLKENVPKFIRKAHELYYGRIYVLFEDKLIPIHFEPKERWINESGFYNSDAYYESYGGYYKTYKIKKEFNLGEPIENIENFQLSRNTWKQNNYMISKFWDKKFW